MGLKLPKSQLFPPNFTIVPSKHASDERYVPDKYYTLPLNDNKLLTPEGHDRVVRQYGIDLTGTNLKYRPGDVLAIYPQNNVEKVN